MAVMLIYMLFIILMLLTAAVLYELTKRVPLLNRLANLIIDNVTICCLDENEDEDELQ